MLTLSYQNKSIEAKGHGLTEEEVRIALQQFSGAKLRFFHLDWLEITANSADVFGILSHLQPQKITSTYAKLADTDESPLLEN